MSVARRSLDGARATKLVARRELRERLRSRVFRVGTLVQVLLVIGISVVVVVTGDEGPDEVKLGTVGTQGAAVGTAARAQEKAFDSDVEVTRYATPDAAAQAVRDGDVDVAVTGDRVIAGNSPDSQTLALVQTASRRLRASEALRGEGLSPTETRRALEPPPLTVDDVSSSDEGGEGLAFVGTLLLYLAILGFGYYVSSGVVEEKSSRVIELILPAIAARHLLAGKVAGIGLVGLIQLAIIAVAGLGVALATGRVDLPSSTPETVALVLLYFLLGYVLYACAFAVAGTIVSRPEDSQSTTSPLLILLVGGYLLSLSVIGDPDSTLAQVCTFLPPLAPLIVPARAAQGALTAPELAISVILMLVAIALLIRVAERIYERTVLHMGAPLKITQALRLARD